MASERDFAPPKNLWAETKSLITDTVGPLALLTLGAQQFTKAITDTVTETRRLQQELAKSEAAAELKRQFEGIGLSARQASQWVGKLAAMSSTSSFNFQSLGTASRALQIMGGASLNTASNLRQMMDVAAATGQPIEDIAQAVGALTLQLKNGDASAASTAATLANYGAISQATAQSIGRMVQAGASSSSSLNLLQRDLNKANGASDALNDSLIGLGNQLQNLRGASDARIGKMFESGQKSALKAEISKEKIGETVRESIASSYAPISNAGNFVKEKFYGTLEKGKDVIGAGAGGLSNLAIGGAAAGAVGVVQLLNMLRKAGGAATGVAGNIANLAGNVAGTVSKSPVAGALFQGLKGSASAVGGVLAENKITGPLYQGISRAAASVFGGGGAAAAEGAAAAAFVETKSAGIFANTFKLIGAGIKNAIVGTLTASAGSFTGIAAGVATAFAYGKGLQNQFNATYSEKNEQRQESAERGGATFKQSQQNLKDAQSGIQSLQGQALESQSKIVASYDDPIKEAQKAVDEAKKKNEGNIENAGYFSSKVDSEGDSMPQGMGLAELFTGKRADYARVKTAEQKLSDLKQEKSLAEKFRDKIQNNFDASTPGATAVQRAAGDMREDGAGARQASVQGTIQALRVQQQYAPSPEKRVEFKKQADDLEDKNFAAKRKSQLMNAYGVAGMKEGKERDQAAQVVNSIGESEAKSRRIMLNAEEVGTPDPGMMGRIGGSAGWAGVVGGPGQNDTKDLQSMSREIVQGLERLQAVVEKAHNETKNTVDKLNK